MTKKKVWGEKKMGDLPYPQGVDFLGFSHSAQEKAHALDLGL